MFGRSPGQLTDRGLAADPANGVQEAGEQLKDDDQRQLLGDDRRNYRNKRIQQGQNDASDGAENPLVRRSN